MNAEELDALASVPDLEHSQTAWRSLYWALVECLSGEGACEALEVGLDTDKYRRRALLRRVAVDMQGGWHPYHDRLLSALLGRLDRRPYAIAATASRLLKGLFPDLPPTQQSAVVGQMLGSRWVIIRRSAYPLMRDAWSASFEDHMIGAWHAHHDPECIPLIARYAPIEMALAEAPTILPIIRGRALADYANRMGLHFDESVGQVRDSNEITYWYLLAKTGRVLSIAEGRAAFLRALGDEQVGLLIWCFGQMGLWELLRELPDLLRTDDRYSEPLADPWPAEALGSTT